MKRLTLIVAAALAVSGVANAHKGATGIVMERMEAMKDIGAATKALANLDWSKPQVARATSAEQTKLIGDHAARIVELFPRGSINGPSEAVPAIWEKPDEFSKIADQLEQASKRFAERAKTATSKDDVQAEFDAIAATCKSCHADFRKRK